MTLEEAKKILEKELAVIDLHKSTEPFEFDESSWIEHEKPSVLEAFRVLAKGGYYISISGHDYNMREKRLKNEYEENTKSPGSAENHIKEDSGVNPALKEAASQFNDALLDEQGKKIKHLTKKIARLNKIIHKKNLKIEEFRKESSRHLRGKIKMFGENLDLEQELKDKDAVLADVAEELRLTKIREKNLAELGLKYVGENEKLKKKLAEKLVDEIDARALKSAESALAYKEKVIAEKDEVIADLGKELAAQKDLVDDISLKYDGAKHNLKLRMDECEKLKEKLEEANNRIKAIRNASKGYCEYGIAAEKMIQKMADVIVYDRPVFSKEFEEYRRWANGYRYTPQLYDFIEEEEKKFSPVKDTHPTEDNPEEVKMNEILEHVRKVLEEGGTVSTSYDKAEEGGDQSATIVQHRKSIVDLFKEIKRLWQE